MGIARFMASTAGRALRVVLGVVLIILGLSMGGAGGIILSIVGLVPIYAGVANVCLIAPLINAPLQGRDATDA